MNKEISTYIIKLPIKTVSESNVFEHWTKRSKRHKNQKNQIADYWKEFKPVINLPAKVVCVRVAPRKLDGKDNLPMSFKYLTDAIAECLTGDYVPGRADSDERITWDFKQEKGNVREYAIRIEIEYSAQLQDIPEVRIPLSKMDEI